jgi:hypothetical protein
MDKFEDEIDGLQHAAGGSQGFYRKVARGCLARSMQ